MTDTKQIIERLKRADKNERRGWGSAYENAPIPTLWLEAASTLEAKDKEISELREALKPFAKAADDHMEQHQIAAEVGGYVPIDDNAEICVPITFGECSRARAKLEGSGA